VSARARASDEPADADAARQRLDELFPESEGPLANEQRIAAKVASLRQLTIISGGPGTGKTTTVVGLLVLLIEQLLLAGHRSPRVTLLAPTGKAAARLVESVAQARRRLGILEPIAAHLPETAMTLHRALRPLGGSTTRFYHDARRPLLADVVVVDEASMVDVALMRRLFEALPLRARVVLLGDKNQLASVEAGAVLADLCGGDHSPTYGATLEKTSRRVFGEPLRPGGIADGGTDASFPLDDSIVLLTHSHRFSGKSDIGLLAGAVQTGDARTVEQILDSGRDVRFIEASPAGGLPRRLRGIVARGFEGLVSGKNPTEVLAKLGRFRILCARRRGPNGVDAANTWAESVLRAAGLVDPSSTWYRGRPVLVTENDYGLGLFNGDVGTALEGPSGPLRVFFTDSSGRPRAVAPARLPRHETAFAMSVHKSQGSEFDEILILLADEASPVLSRELLYTAVTRARRRVTIIGPRASLRRCVERRAHRISGLVDALRSGAV
jgi:exodeoxyribonuclease V alpha subunit